MSLQFTNTWQTHSYIFSMIIILQNCVKNYMIDDCIMLMSLIHKCMYIEYHKNNNTTIKKLRTCTSINMYIYALINKTDKNISTLTGHCINKL